MQVKSIAECSKGTLTFIKLPFVVKIFVLSIFEWPFYTGFTVPVLEIICNDSSDVQSYLSLRWHIPTYCKCLKISMILMKYNIV